MICRSNYFKPTQGQGNNLKNQVTYVYNCLENDTYSKQFVAFTYIFERSILDPDDDSACWQETVYVSLGVC